MIVAIIITVVLAIALFFVTKSWYKRLITQYPSTSAMMSGAGSLPPAFYMDWTGTLNLATQRYTTQQFCHQKGYDYEAPVGAYDYGSCLYTEDTCKADSNPNWVNCSFVTGSTGGVDNSGKACDLNQRPYLEWHTDSTGKGRCLISSFPPGFIQQVCQAKGLGEWYQGNPDCDSSGYCTLNPNDLPTCKITSDYCDRMGLDWENSNNLGNCNLSDLQNVFEGIFGKTETRTWKRNTEAMIRECSNDIFSANCASSVGTELFTQDEIAINMADTEFNGYMNNLKQACSGDIYSSMDSFANCSANLFPAFYLQQQAQKFADGMLNGALGWIPGMPSNLFEKLSGYQYKYGKVALNAVFHAGEDAIKAFDIAGDAMYAALDNIGLGAEGSLVRGAIGNVIKFGGAMAGIIAQVAQEAIHIFANDIVPAAYEVFHAVCDAVLHPKEFFSNIGKDIGKFLADPVGSIKDAFTYLAGIGSDLLDAATAVVNKLLDVADQIGLGPLADDLKDIANHLKKALNEFSNDLKGAAEAVGGFFNHLI